jgi:hypothetical protein
VRSLVQPEPEPGKPAGLEGARNNASQARSTPSVPQPVRARCSPGGFALATGTLHLNFSLLVLSLSHSPGHHQDLWFRRLLLVPSPSPSPSPSSSSRIIQPPNLQLLRHQVGRFPSVACSLGQRAAAGPRPNLLLRRFRFTLSVASDPQPTNLSRLHPPANTPDPARPSTRFSYRVSSVADIELGRRQVSATAVATLASICLCSQPSQRPHELRTYHLVGPTLFTQCHQTVPRQFPLLGYLLT